MSAEADSTPTPSSLAFASKSLGNQAFDAQRYGLAIRHYTAAISHSPSAALHSNRAAAWLRMGRDARALSDADAAAALDPDWPKAHFRRAQALSALQRFDEALAALDHAAHLAPHDAAIRRARHDALMQRRAAQRTPAPGTVEAARAALSTPSLEPHMPANRPLEPGDFAAAWLATALGEAAAGAPCGAYAVLLGAGAAQAAVALDDAFTAPEPFEGAARRLRCLASDVGARAVVVVAWKCNIEYPRTWERARGGVRVAEGVLVHTEDGGRARAQFVAVRQREAGRWALGEVEGLPEELDFFPKILPY